MTENEFLLTDRIQKIRSINEQYDLEHEAYISFSGGKDSTVLSYIVDLALPGNKIPRVFINTGIEYKAITDFVSEVKNKDSRIEIIKPEVPITKVLKEYGYPFKSKEHSLYLSVFQNSGFTKSVNSYLQKENRFACSKSLRYQFTEDFKIKVSNKCCYKLKKEPASRWAKVNNKTVTITGMRTEEGGLRAALKGCTIFEEGNLQKFHPLLPVSDSFINWVVEKYKIELCSLYYPPFNFARTGCKGCPYNIKLQEQLDIMSNYLPAEEKQCEIIWKPIYSEYRRIGYRLRNSIQKELFI